MSLQPLSMAVDHVASAIVNVGGSPIPHAGMMSAFRHPKKQYGLDMPHGHTYTYLKDLWLQIFGHIDIIRIIVSIWRGRRKQPWGN